MTDDPARTTALVTAEQLTAQVALIRPWVTGELRRIAVLLYGMPVDVARKVINESGADRVRVLLNMVDVAADALATATRDLAAAQQELEHLRLVAVAASNADWHFKREGKGRLTDADYALLWSLRDALEPLREWAATQPDSPPADAGAVGEGI